jgi:hypothetical protein
MRALPVTVHVGTAAGPQHSTLGRRKHTREPHLPERVKGMRREKTVNRTASRRDARPTKNSEGAPSNAVFVGWGFSRAHPAYAFCLSFRAQPTIGTKFEAAKRQEYSTRRKPRGSVAGNEQPPEGRKRQVFTKPVTVWSNPKLQAKSLIPKILEVNYLESRFCQGRGRSPLRNSLNPWNLLEPCKKN